MDYDQSGDRLTVRLTRDFNWLAVRRIEPLAQSVQHVDIDLSGARLIDSEALMLIDRLQRAGKTVQLRNPPDLLYEIIDALEAESVFDVDTLVS
jgi:ABC-type transporter Mla MlaB component